MSGVIVEGIAVEGMVLLRGMVLLWNEMVEVKESRTIDLDI